MKCNHCGSEWTTAAENQKATCPFCGKQLENTNSNQPAARGRFQLSYDKTTLVQFLGDEKNVVVPAGITRIGAGAFHGYGVETVYIPDGVTEIGDNCFNGCKQLREVRIPASVTHISDSAFKDTCKKKIIAEKGSYAWNKYAKPVVEDKPVAPIAPVEPKLINKAVSAPPAKPAESDAKASKVPITTQPASNMPSAKELYEQQVDEFLALQHKKAQWAQLLGCEPGDRPWIIKASLFVSADKRAKNLIARIKNIHDQELLARIEEETNDGRVRLAAVENITDQNRLFSVVNDTQNPNIRRAAVERITDPNLLKQLANNKNDDVRNTAFLRIASPTELKKHLMVSANKQDVSALNRISNTSDMLDIALSAKCDTIRIAAADMLPARSAEGNLLKAAAAFSKEITMEGIVHYDDAHLTCQKANPDFLQKVAAKHPDPCVRYLARGRKNVEAKGNSFEEQMKSQTLSQREVTLREVDQLRGDYFSKARSEVIRFMDQCNAKAAQGETSHRYTTCLWTSTMVPREYRPHGDFEGFSVGETYYSWTFPFKLHNHVVHNDRDFLSFVLRRCLHERGLRNAQVTLSPISGTSYNLYSYDISTTW